MLLRFIDGTVQNSRQWLDNANQTHPLLASGKLVLQNSIRLTLKVGKVEESGTYMNSCQVLVGANGWNCWPC